MSAEKRPKRLESIAPPNLPLLMRPPLWGLGFQAPINRDRNDVIVAEPFSTSELAFVRLGEPPTPFEKRNKPYEL